MKTLFYRYLRQFDPRVSTYYTPAFVLPKQAQLLASVAKMEDELVPDDKYKILANSLPADWRYGKISFEPEALAAIGWDDETMKEMAVGISSNFALSFPTNSEVAGQLRAFTNLEETEPGLFLVSAAVTEGTFTCEAKYIDCR